MADALFGGRVAVKEELGRGAMGVVHRAELEGETVAIKILHAHLTADVAVVGRFVREHQALRRVQHPNVVRVKDLVIGDPLIGMVMEFLEATDLSVVLRDDPPTPAEAVAMMVDITAGVAAIHDANVVHRDLKPANIMITSDGEAKITDFGISRLLSANEAGRTTATIGTPLYMSPEAAGSGDPIGSASDIYSLGVILFELLIGEPPFNNGEPLAVAVAHVNNPPPSVGGVPNELSSLIDEMLSKSPTDRPTARELQDRLRSLTPLMADDIEPVAVPAGQPPTVTLQGGGDDSSSGDSPTHTEGSPLIDLTDGSTGSVSSLGAESDQTVVVAGVATGAVGSADSTMVAPLAESGVTPAAYVPGASNPMLDTEPTGLGEAPTWSAPGVGLADDSTTVMSPRPSTEPRVNLLNQTGETGIDGSATMGSPPFTGPSLGTDRSPLQGVDPGPSRGPVMAAIGAFLLLALLLVALFRPGGWLRSTDVEGPSIAYSFAPTLAENGLITTRLWSFNPDEDAIEAEVVITNSSEDEVDLDHYEVMPAEVDRDQFLDSLTPNPDEVRTAGGVRGDDGAAGGTLTVARFNDRGLGGGQTFRIRYSFAAPDGLSGLSGLESLAFDQQAAETDFLATVPSAGLPVEVDVERLELDPAELALEVGSTASVSLSGNLAEGDESLSAVLELASWTVSDTDVATVSGRGLARTVTAVGDGETALIVQLGDLEVEIPIVVGDELSGPSSPRVTVPSTTETTDTTEPDEQVTTETTEEPVADLTMSALNVSINDDGSFRVTFQTNLCTIANYQGAGQSYITPGWPNVVDRCWESHAQPFTAVEPGSYSVSVSSRSADGQQASRSTTVVIEEPEQPVDELTMSALDVTVNDDGSFLVAFETNLCTIANYQGAGQSYVTPGWPEVTGACRKSHSQPFTAVDPDSYVITVSSRSADGQQASRSTTVVVEDSDPPVTDPPVTDPPITDPPVTDPPITDPPVTDPPITDPPITDPPITEPDATLPTVTISLPTIP